MVTWPPASALLAKPQAAVPAIGAIKSSARRLVASFILLSPRHGHPTEMRSYTPGKITGNAPDPCRGLRRLQSGATIRPNTARPPLRPHPEERAMARSCAADLGFSRDRPLKVRKSGKPD